MSELFFYKPCLVHTLFTVDRHDIGVYIKNYHHQSYERQIEVEVNINAILIYVKILGKQSHNESLK